MDEDITWDSVRKFYVPKEHIPPSYEFSGSLAKMLDDMVQTTMRDWQSAYGGAYAYSPEFTYEAAQERFDDGVFVVDGEAWEPRGFLNAAETQESPQSDADD